MVFRATDPTNAFVEDGITVTVLPINDAPEIAPLPSITINETEIYELNLDQYISDVDTNISNINILVEDPNIMVSGTSLVIFGSTELPEQLIIFVNDGELTSTGLLNIKVVSEPQPKGGTDFTIILFIIILIIIIIIILSIVFYLHRREQKFEIEEIFLIHNSGKLLSHVYYKTHSKFDDEIFSGMFTAIQEFIEDSFTGDDQISGAGTDIGGNSIETKSIGKPMKLNEFKVGDNQVIIEHGKYIFMAVVYRGRGANALHRLIKRNIYLIENKFNNELEYWDGDMYPLRFLRLYLEKLIPKNKPDKSKIDELEQDSEVPKTPKTPKAPRSPAAAAAPVNVRNIKDLSLGGLRLQDDDSN